MDDMLLYFPGHRRRRRGAAGSVGIGSVAADRSNVGGVEMMWRRPQARVASHVHKCRGKDVLLTAWPKRLESMLPLLIRRTWAARAINSGRISGFTALFLGARGRPRRAGLASEPCNRRKDSSQEAAACKIEGKSASSPCAAGRAAEMPPRARATDCPVGGPVDGKINYE
jgi:hypothetical protein